ncbi:unnamed protein product, partial [Cuscuta europaea]
MHCSKCRKEGHNARRCPEDPNNKEKLLQPRKRKPKSAPRHSGGSVGESAGNEDVGAPKVSALDEDNLMDINMQYEDFPSLGLEFPIVVSVEDTSMFTQVSDQEAEKLSG